MDNSTPALAKLQREAYSIEGNKLDNMQHLLLTTIVIDNSVCGAGAVKRFCANSIVIINKFCTIPQTEVIL